MAKDESKTETKPEEKKAEAAPKPRRPKIGKLQNVKLSRALAMYPGEDPVPAHTTVAKVAANDEGLAWLGHALRNGMVYVTDKD